MDVLMIEDAEGFAVVPEAIEDGHRPAWFREAPDALLYLLLLAKAHRWHFNVPNRWLKRDRNNLLFEYAKEQVRTRTGADCLTAAIILRAHLIDGRIVSGGVR